MKDRRSLPRSRSHLCYGLAVEENWRAGRRDILLQALCKFLIWVLYYQRWNLLQRSNVASTLPLMSHVHSILPMTSLSRVSSYTSSFNPTSLSHLTSKIQFTYRNLNYIILKRTWSISITRKWHPQTQHRTTTHTSPPRTHP